MRKYKLAVLIGRFQPFHDGHKAVLDNGFKHADNVLLFLGSHDAARTIANPWSSTERANLINSIYAETEFAHRIDFFPLEDRPYNDTYWMRAIQTEVNSRGLKDEEVCILGHKKDKATARYLGWFPQWASVEVTNPVIINATDIRDFYFDPYKNDFGGNSYLEDFLPKQTYAWLKTIENRPSVKYIKNEYEFQMKHDKMWASAPYPPMFITVDSVVVCSGHVLLIKRRSHPGKDLWALPGGYLNKGEWIQDGALRELEEETKIDVPPDALKNCIKDVQVFDAPNRSTRGRIVTHAHLIKLKDQKLPKIKGSDDAAKAKWIPFANIKRSECFEDHYDIIHTMLSRLNKR